MPLGLEGYVLGVGDGQGLVLSVVEGFEAFLHCWDEAGTMGQNQFGVVVANPGCCNQSPGSYSIDHRLVTIAREEAR